MFHAFSPMTTTDHPSVSELLSRIERLERRTRLQRQALALTAVGLLTACGIAAGVGTTDGKFDTVSCSRLVLVDSENRVRLEASSLAEGAAGLRILDTEGRPRMIAATTAEGSFTQSIRDAQGEMRIILGSMPNGYAGINLYDSKGNLSIDASTDAQGAVTLSRADSAPAGAAARTASSLEEAREQYMQAKKEFEAEEKRVATMRAFQNQTAGQLAVNGHYWAEAPQVDREVARRYYAARARYHELGGR